MNAEFFALAFTAALNPKLLALDLLLIENRRPRAMFLCVLLGGMTVAPITVAVEVAHHPGGRDHRRERQQEPETAQTAVAFGAVEEELVAHPRDVVLGQAGHQRRSFGSLPRPAGDITALDPASGVACGHLCWVSLITAFSVSASQAA